MISAPKLMRFMLDRSESLRSYNSRTFRSGSIIAVVSDEMRSSGEHFRNSSVRITSTCSRLFTSVALTIGWPSLVGLAQHALTAFASLRIGMPNDYRSGCVNGAGDGCTSR